MKVYKVYFDNDFNTWSLLNQGFLSFPYYKTEYYKKCNEFNNPFFQNLTISNKKPCVNTFNENEIEKSLFFFLDLFDAIKYVSYPSSKFGVLKSIPTEYKILELELPDELILKYLGIGNYEFEKEYVYNLAIEVAIPFDELQRAMNSFTYDGEIIRLDNVKLYGADDYNIVKILNYLSINPNYKSQNYIQSIERILHILGFEVVLGTIYKRFTSGKFSFIQNSPERKVFLLKKMISEIINEINENLEKCDLPKNSFIQVLKKD